MAQEKEKRDTLISATLRALLVDTQDLMFIKDADLVYRGASRAFAEMAGAGSPEDILGKTDFDIFTDKSLARRYVEDDRHIMASGLPMLNYVEPLPDKDGKRRWASTSKYIIRGPEGDILGMYGIGRDITFAHEARQNYDRELQYLFHGGDDVLCTVLVDVTDWKVTDSFFMRGYDGILPQGDIESYTVAAAQAVVDGTQARAFFENFNRAYVQSLYDSGKRVDDLSYTRRLPGGREGWVRESIHFLLNPETGHLEVVLLLRDASAEKQAMDALATAATYDAMTGLLNRAATLNGVRELLRGEGREGTHALFMIDVDGFKAVNDTFGHQKGDSVLTDIAGAIRACFRESDLVGRTGGDEFMVLMKNAGNSGVVARKASELIEALQYVCTDGQTTLELSGSVGVVLYKGDGRSVEELYAEADAALYRAKEGGRNRYAWASGEPVEEAPATEPADALQLHTLLRSMEDAVIVAEVRNGAVRVVFNSKMQAGVQWGDDARDGFGGVVPEDWFALTIAMQKAARDGSLLDHVYRSQNPDGAIVWRHIRGARMPMDADGVARLVTVSSDITGLKESEEALSFAQLRYRTAMEQSNMLLFEVDIRRGTLTFTGPLAERLGIEGATMETGPGRFSPPKGFFRNDSMAEYVRMCRNIFDGDDSGDYSLVVLDAEGREHLCSGRFHLLYDADGRPYYAVGILEPSMPTQELALYRIMSHGGVYSVRVDEKLTLQYANDRFFSILGYSREELGPGSGRGIAQLFNPQDLAVARARAQELLGDPGLDQSKDMVFRMTDHDGNEKYLRTSGRLSVVHDGAVVSGVLLDITDQKRVELELERRRSEAEARYRNVLAMRDAADKNVVYTFVLNLTRNTFEPGYMNENGPVGLNNAASADALLVMDKALGTQEDAGFTREGLLAVFEKGSAYLASERLIVPLAGRRRWVRTTASMARNPATGDVECVLQTRDIDRERTVQGIMDRFMDVEYEFVAAVHLPEGDVELLRGVDEGMPYVPHEGVNYRNALPTLAEKAIEPEMQTDFLEKMDLATVGAALKTAPTYTCTFSVRVTGQDGTARKRWMFSRLDEREDILVYARSDVTAMHEAETDALTGLLTKQAFRHYVRRRLGEEPDTAFTLLRFDIDRFKVFNDVLGTENGDRLLRAIGAALRARCRQCVLCHIEADQFALLCPDTGTEGGIAAGISAFLKEYPADFRVQASFGVYPVTDRELDVSLMLDRALLALHTVKKNYTDKVAVYKDSMRLALLEEQALLDNVEEALAGGQFILYFQPQVDSLTGALVGAEALVRWQHPTRGLLEPAAFVPLFERGSIIGRLDEYVWERSCRYVRKWLDDTKTTVPVSVAVNISRFDLYDPGVCDRLLDITEKYKLTPGALKLEITENAYMDDARQLVSVVKRLREMGFTVEMDDFGSGFSALSTLKNVPVDVLKLDVHFLADDQDGRGGVILSSVVDMAQKLGLPVIAEGVETMAQAEYLKALGCRYMQGYCFGRPMPAEDFEKLLADNQSLREERDAGGGRLSPGKLGVFAPQPPAENALPAALARIALLEEALAKRQQVAQKEQTEASPPGPDKLV